MKDIKQVQEGIIRNMKTWQKAEDESIASANRIMDETKNPVVRMVMEIIQRDSEMHRRVQKWIADSLESETVILSPDEMAAIWDQVQSHIELENRMIKSAENTLDSLKDTQVTVQQYFINYLLDDECKHSNLLKSLEIIKRELLPYGPSQA